MCCDFIHIFMLAVAIRYVLLWKFRLRRNLWKFTQKSCKKFEFKECWTSVCEFLSFYLINQMNYKQQLINYLKYLQDYSELLEENHYFFKPFTTVDVIDRAEIKMGGELTCVLW